METKVALPIEELVKTLTKEQQDKVLAYIQELLPAKKDDKSGKDPNWMAIKGIYKGKIWITDDFDEPLEDFKEYM